MLITKFEEKVANYALEQGWIPKDMDSVGYNFFGYALECRYKLKKLTFYTTCENVEISFYIADTKIENLLDRAYKLVKSITTEVRKNNTENVTEKE